MGTGEYQGKRGCVERPMMPSFRGVPMFGRLHREMDREMRVLGHQWIAFGQEAAMGGNEPTTVLFILGFGPIVRDITASRTLYRDALGIAFKEEEGGYLHTESVEGAKTFALWPLSEAARSCFGTDAWPAEIPAPQAWLEFDVADVQAATTDLESRGYRMLVKNQKEPWGQTVSRFLTPEGLLLGVTFTPSMRG